MGGMREGRVTFGRGFRPFLDGGFRGRVRVNIRKRGVIGE